MSKRMMKFIVVKRGNKTYKLFLADLRKIYTREKTVRPPVPDFDYQSMTKRMSIETASSEIDT